MWSRLPGKRSGAIVGELVSSVVLWRSVGIVGRGGSPDLAHSGLLDLKDGC